MLSAMPSIKPPRRAALPLTLDDRPFHILEAAGRGVSANRLRLDDLVIPTPGIRTARPPVDLMERARVFALALPPGTVFSHTTALELWGLPVERRAAGSVAPVLHVMRETSTPPLVRTGCVSHRGLESRQVDVVNGLQVTTPLYSWLDSATLLDRDDLVAIGDALVMPPWDLTPGELVALAERTKRRRGVRRAREAAALVRRGSASPQESRARCVFVDWGLPEPELNVDIHEQWGTWLARGDFVWWEWKVVAEYDGDQHRTDRSKWQYERRRRAKLEDAGWTYVEMTSDALWWGPAQDEVIGRLQRALQPSRRVMDPRGL